jgi:phenylacetate-coenzyme A ligase PaaK-like adenylate-forming protein
LANRVQPLIRYDLGDRVTLAPEPCPCGSPFPAVGIEGRAGDLVSFRAADGGTVTVLPLALGTVIEETPGVRRFQAIRTGPGNLTVRLETWPGADPAQVRRAVTERLNEYFAALGAGPVAIEHTDEQPRPDPSGKFRQVWSAG